MQGVPLISLHEAGISANAREDGVTFFENAFSKALFYSRALAASAAAAQYTIAAVLAEDSGICVDALGGRPGVYSARYGEKEPSPDLDKAHPHYQCQLLQKELRDASSREAHFMCCAVLLVNSDEFYCAQRIWRGSISESDPSGTGGFGYDPVFVPAGRTCTAAELSPEEKNASSHRAHALGDLRPHIERVLAQKNM